MEVLSLSSFTDALILRRCSSPGDPVSFCSSAELATDSGPDSDYFSIVSSEESADSCSDVELGDSGTLIARALYLSSCPEDIIWPREWPLPLPLWSPAPECLCVASCDALRQFVARLDRLLLQHLREYTYDSVDVWLRFWRAFSDWRASGECGDVGAEFADWRRTFRVPADSDSLTCAGLSYKFLDQLASVDPLAARHFYTVSVEESVEFPLVYTSNCCPPLCNENDHVLLACRFTFTESGAARHGVLLVDSGLHVSRTVVVMQDGLPPHTGQFTVGSISAALYHNYQLSDNGLFVYNTITKQRAGCLASSSVSCMFIGGRFESAFSFAEHRSVFYPVHAIVRRSRRGHPCAGVYFDAAATNTAPSLTLFYSADASDDSPAAVTKRRVSLAAAAARPAGGHTVVERPAGECSVSHCDAPCVDQQHQEAIVAVCRQMGVSVRHFELLVRQVTPALLDTQFRQLLSDANLQILDISKNN